MRCLTQARVVVVALLAVGVAAGSPRDDHRDGAMHLVDRDGARVTRLRERTAGTPPTQRSSAGRNRDTAIHQATLARWWSSGAALNRS